jgi:hypothetical protein
MYVFFIFIVASAEMLDWAPNIRVIAFVPCKILIVTQIDDIRNIDVVVCMVLVELGRLFSLKPKWDVIMPLYSTVIPFALICFFSREARILQPSSFHSCHHLTFVRHISVIAILLFLPDHIPSKWRSVIAVTYYGIHNVVLVGLHRISILHDALLCGYNRSGQILWKNFGSRN